MNRRKKKNKETVNRGWVFAIHPFTHSPKINSPIHPFTDSPNDGFTLVELVIAMTVILIVSLGFFSWSSLIVGTNVSIERNNFAYAMAVDVADRLQRMYDNSLIQPRSSSKRCVGFAASGTDLKGCSTANCAGGSPNVDISVGGTGMTTFTNPYGSSKLYLYDKNYCENKTWVDTDCGDAAANIDIDTTANSNIDHPNAAGSAYDEVNPIRSYKSTTYYAVWSVAYIPCNAGTDTNRRKIFITVYWIDPEPTETAVAAVESKINNGYTIKSVSLVVDKAIGTEVYTGS